VARISELHYSNTYAASSGISEFLEVSLSPGEDASDFSISFYEANGTEGLAVSLTDPGVQFSYDAETDEYVYIISADYFDILLTDPDGGGTGNYEAYALVNTDTSSVIDFYDIGGGTQNILATDGLAAGATSENLDVLVGPNSTTTTIQFNADNPDEQVFEGAGAGDTGVACFVAGTLIATPDGERPVDELVVGDLVLTADHGPQPIRWCGARSVPGHGGFAPIRLDAATFGGTQDLLVSPHHRILIEGWKSEMLFGEPQVLVAAVHLINDLTVRRAPCEQVTYHHIMFDQHEVLTSNGIASESFYPGDAAMNALVPDAAEEIFTLFPELKSHQESYSVLARTELKAFEGRLCA
jgi:hypothetical protein